MQEGLSRLFRGCCRASVRRIRASQGRDEAISATGQRLDVLGAERRIAQAFAELIYGRVQAMVEVHEGIGGPQFLAQIFAGHHFSMALQKHGQYLKRLFLQAELDAVLAEFASRKIKLEDSEAHNLFVELAAECRHDGDRDAV